MFKIPKINGPRFTLRGNISVRSGITILVLAEKRFKRGSRADVRCLTDLIDFASESVVGMT